MSSVVSKEDAHKLVYQLPPNATWDDLMHKIYVREAIERGLENSRAGRTIDVADIRKKYGLPECIHQMRIKKKQATQGARLVSPERRAR